MIPVRPADLSGHDDIHTLHLLPTGGAAMISTVTDNIYERPEVLRLSDAAFRMHVSALAWAAAHETSPEIPSYALAAVSPLGDGNDLIDELVGSGLWQPTEVDGLGFTILGALPFVDAQRDALPIDRLPYRVEGTGSTVGYFRDISVSSSTNRTQGSPFPKRVIDGIPRAHAIVAVAESILRAHGRQGHHALALEVNLSTHPYLRAIGDQSAEWVRLAFAVGELTADVPNWRGAEYADLTAFADGDRYPGQAGRPGSSSTQMIVPPWA